MAHLLAWQQSVDQATPAAINTVVDDVFTRTGATRYLVPPEERFVHWGLASGLNLTRAYLSAPSMDVQRSRPDIIPHARGASVLTLTGQELWIPHAPIELQPSEEIQALTSEDGAGATQQNVIISVGPQTLPAAPAGPVRIIRCTGATNLVAYAWTSVVVTPELSLEPGEYALVGFDASSATAIAVRAVILGQVYRPGLPALAGTEAVAKTHDAASRKQLPRFDMGHFTHITVPEFQFFAAAADAAEVITLYVVKIG